MFRLSDTHPNGRVVDCNIILELGVRRVDEEVFEISWEESASLCLKHLVA